MRPSVKRWEMTGNPVKSRVLANSIGKKWKGERKVRGSIDFIRFSQLFPFPFRL